MSNSALVNYTCISPNSNNPRNTGIKKITIHHMAGNLSVETCGKIFASSARQASSNYGIGSDGRVGMYVEEKNRSWCSSSPSNDHQAVTIEVANDETGGDWHVSDKALAKLIDLCVDICQRNGIDRLNYTGDTTGNLTMHCWFSATSCPGPYLKSKFPYIAEEVNKRLGGSGQAEAGASIQKGDLVKIAPGAVYYNGAAIPSWVKNQSWYVSQVSGDRAVIDKNESGTSSICSPVNTKYLSAAGSTGTAPAPSEPKKIEAGGKVKVTGSQYTNGVAIPSYVKGNTYTVQQVKSDRVLLKEIYSWVPLSGVQAV